MPTLILTPRFTEDTQALWRAALSLGWGAKRLTGWRVTEELLAIADPVLYVEGMFAATFAEQMGMTLLEPAVDWLPHLSEAYRKRTVRLTTMQEARQLTAPAFVKPPNDKTFPARVYVGSTLPEGYDDASQVLVAEVVEWEKEFRCFFLDRKPYTLSVYLRKGELQREQDFAASDAELAEAQHFVQSVLADSAVDFPKAGVLDVGVIAGRGWAVVEQNAAWGSGIYGCDPVAVLEVLRWASRKQGVGTLWK